MKPLPPTLREKRRYVLIRISGGPAELAQKDIYRAVLDAVSGVFGDFGAAKIHPAVVWSEGAYAIVRCTRGTEKDLCAALACVSRCAGESAAFRTVVTSGTIAGAKDKMGHEVPDFAAHPGYAVCGKKADGSAGAMPRYVTVDEISETAEK
ncbi:MAG TPA: ribonuclease P [Methanocorpusculum sp.]|nr:ribonuclease P [Methanocorpusculum sp.]